MVQGNYRWTYEEVNCPLSAPIMSANINVTPRLMLKLGAGDGLELFYY